MHGYTHILLAENTVKSQLRDTAVTQEPLSVLAFGRIYDDEINATPGVNRPNGRKDYQLLYVKQGTLQITIDNKQQNLTQNTLILLRPGEPQLYKGLYKGKQVVDRLFVHFSGYHAAKLLEQYNITESIMQFSEPLDAFEDIISKYTIKHSLTKVNLSEGLLTIAKDELNIKEFEILHDASKFVSYKLKPQLKTLGPKYGKAIGAIRNFLDTCNAAEVVACVKAGKTYKVNLDGTDVEFALDDLLISSESAEGYVSESSDGLTVVLDVHISEELMLEGAVRELVSRIQNMRKEAGFEVTDRIVLGYKAEGVSGRVLKEMADEIKSDVLAEEITTTPDGYVKDFDINGESVTLGVKKV